LPILKCGKDLSPKGHLEGILESVVIVLNVDCGL
jgi:hypothetical protein